MNVLVIGKPRYDIILPLEKYPLDGESKIIKEKIEVAAGTSLYVACMLAKWNIKTYYAGSICGDELGNKIKNTLDRYNVDTKFVEVDYEHKSPINYVLLNRTNGQTTNILHDNEIYLKKYKYDFVPDYIITDGSDMGASIAALNNYPTSKMILFANKVNEEFYNLSKRVSYVCANIDFAEALTKMKYDFNRPKSLVELFQKIKDLNKAEYILMLRDKGVMYISERNVKMIPAIKIDKKDDSNSGSSFFGAYAYGIIKGLNADVTAKIANAAGGLALTKVGSIYTIPEIETVFNTVNLQKELENINNDADVLQEDNEIPTLASENKEGTTNEKVE